MNRIAASQKAVTSALQELKVVQKQTSEETGAVLRGLANLMQRNNALLEAVCAELRQRPAEANRRSGPPSADGAAS